MKSYQYDIYRYYGRNKETFKQRLARPVCLKYIVLYRKCRACNNSLVQVFYRYRLQRLANKTSIQIPYVTEIGKGFYISHFGSVIINPNVVIGENCNIASGVVIGQENRGKRKGVPTIGSSVWIGSNAVVVGNIRIGNDVLIAPLTYCNFDVPDHSIVIGNPGKVIPKENATDMYINRKV